MVIQVEQVVLFQMLEAAQRRRVIAGGGELTLQARGRRPGQSGDVQASPLAVARLVVVALDPLLRGVVDLLR